MSRSGYVEDGDCDHYYLYRASVDRSIRGKRGQAFLREMLDALDAMPVKQLIAGEVMRDNDHVCAIGSVALARKIDVSKLDITDGEAVGKVFGIAPVMAREIAYHNDDDFSDHPDETPAERWQRMRRWVVTRLRTTQAPPEGEQEKKGQGA